MDELIMPSFGIKTISIKTEVALTQETPEPLRPKGVQYLDWRLLQYMYDRYFRYGAPCFVKASRLAHILSPGKGTAASIRNSRCRLKKFGLITVENMRSDFSCKMVAYCFLSPKGRELMIKLFNMKTKPAADNDEDSAVQPREAPPMKDSHKRYTNFDYRVSRRFSKQIQKAYPMKRPIQWNEEQAECIRRLREIDKMTEEEILQTVEYILQDNQPKGEGGFCLAKVIRSPLQFRAKWKNGMSKFISAYEDMKAKKLANPDINDESSLPPALRPLPKTKTSPSTTRKILTPPRNITSKNEIHKLTAETYENLLSLPKPNWKLTDKRFLEFEQFAYDLSMFFEELIEDRNWKKTIVEQFFKVLEVDNKNLKFFTTDILREKVSVFFNERVPKFFKSEVGTFNQWRENAKGEKLFVIHWWDETYQQRVEDFLIDQKNLEPFENATEIIDDSEVTVDHNGTRFEKGTFQTWN